MIHPTAIIHANVEIGEGTIVEAYAVIGSPAEHRDYMREAPGRVVIGKNCIIREYVTINAGTVGPTVVGDDCTLLRGSHVGHDAVLGNKVTLSCNALVGGHSYVMDFSNIGLGAVIRQKLVVGPGVMLGMNACATKNLEPWGTYAGVPAKLMGQNTVGIERSKLSDDDLQILALAFYACTKNQA
jgi:UDP-N-acetylglucosamine acyltransferase